MDRQSLLEQKRQRLQELKLRRLTANTSPSKSIDDLIDSLQQQPKGKLVDVAIQVDSIVSSSTHTNPVPPVVAKPRSLNTYDKGIQVELVETKHPNIPKSDPVPEPIPAAKQEPEAAEELNGSLVDSLKRLNRVLAQDADLPSLFADFTKVAVTEATIESQPQYSVEQILPPVPGRRVADIDISSEFIVVAYTAFHQDPKTADSAANRIRYAPGLAIIYSIRANKPLPEFFLESSTPISKIRFERPSVTKIVGGLNDGKIVIWDVTNTEPNKINVLPSLKSSLLASIGSTIKTQSNTSSVKFIHHTSEIVFLDIISTDSSSGGSSSIISISKDGVLNIWSTNFLASPKLNSIKLCVPSKLDFLQTKYVESMFVEKALLLENNIMTASKSLANHSPEYRFLDRVVVGTSSGKMYKLTNDKTNGFIDTTYDVEPNKFDTFVANKASSIIELHHKNEPFIVTSHYNWTLQIWRLTSVTPIVTIPTSSLIIDSCPRPNHPLQFVTVGTIKDSKLLPIVLFWDLGVNLMTPLFEVSLPAQDTTYANPVRFNTDGSKLLIGLNDASVVVWDIDDAALAQEYDSVGDNLESFIRK